VDKLKGSGKDFSPPAAFVTPCTATLQFCAPTTLIIIPLCCAKEKDEKKFGVLAAVARNLLALIIDNTRAG
jgi:hypothetical protein